MKVTPALKKELTNWLDTYWTTYLQGDIETWATFIRDDYRNIGGTKEEIWNSKQEILVYTNSILNQMIGTVDIRNRKVELIPYGEFMMVNEFTDLYVKIEGEWTFYGPFRMSSLLEKTNSGWIALHQHGSYPDMKAMKGEAFSIDALQAENAKLQAAVKSRTMELEHKNRELEIEAATERVRVQSMAMQQPADLGKVNKELLTQLTKLEIAGLSGVSFYFIDQDEIVTVWDLSSPGNMNDPNSYSFRFDSKKHPVIGEFVGILKSTQENYFILDFPKDRLLQAIEEIKEIDINIANNFKHAVESGTLLHQWNPAARISDGILSIDLMIPPTEDTKTIVLKMAGAFNQAYQRFLDLQKAAAQAKEAEIELALERVRARSMAMHKSEELAEASVLLFEQLKLLGVSTYSSGFSIWENEDLISWMCNADGSINPPFTMPVGGDAWHRLQHASWKKREAFIWKDLRGEEMQSHFRYLRSFPLLDEAFKKSIAAGHPMPERQVHHVANFSQGNLLFITLQPCPEAHDIFIRFAKVFEQTYTRFLDLQKAEAQAKETEIQLALERVRARSMAMHKSEELSDLSLELVKQVQALGVATWFCAFNIKDEDPNSSLEWGSNGKGTFPQYRTPREGIFLRYYKAGQRGETFLINEISKNECPAHYEYLCNLPGVGDQLLQMKNAGIPFPASQIDHVAFFKYGYLIFITYEPAPEAHDIFKRFAKVFEQTYTRFLDLQRAEAQAKEAKIEAALERVRSRTMAMMQSDELQDTALLLVQQVKALGVPTFACGFNIWDDDKTASTAWMAGEDRLQPPFKTSSSEDVFLHIHEAVLKGEQLFIAEQGGRELETHYRYMASIPAFKAVMDKMAQAGLSVPTFQIIHCAFFSQGYLMFISFEPVPEAHDIFKRFAKAFEQTYTRFIDLQKAEAQAREAQIEAGLERTRTQSMLMQHSNELDITSKVFHEQLLLLGIDSELSYVWLPDVENDKHLFWATWNEEKSGSNILQSKSATYDLDRTEPYTAECFNAWESGEPVHVYPVASAEVEHYFDTWSGIMGDAKKLKPEFFPDGLDYVESFMKYGCFGIIIRRRFTEDEKKILLRFTIEFERTYTRFLDLQKAEAQAREANIESALERVRSRAMAMQTSEELNALIGTVFTELTRLDLVLTRCLIMIFNEKKNDSRWWMANSEDPEHPMGFDVKSHDHPPIAAYFKAWRDKKLKWTYVLEGQIKNEWDDFIFSETELSQLPDFVQEGMRAPGKINLNVSFNNFGCITLASLEPLPQEHFDIMLRFAKVFDLTYTRFNDLKQAEAQAKEAKIEAALERVRSRSLAMHRTTELQTVIHSLHRELLRLNLSISGGSFIAINGEIENEIHCWGAGGTADTSDEVHIPRFEKPFYTNLLNGMKNGPGFFTEEYTREEKIEFFNFLFNHEPWSKLGGTEKKETLLAPGGYTRSCAVSKHTSIFIINHFGERFSAADNDILQRFGKVFEQAYTRFLDLQKAEAQAREAQIELGLERVRARAMAMQHSNELSDLVDTVFKELTKLDFAISMFIINIIDENTLSNMVWGANPDTGKPPESYYMKFEDYPFHHAMMKGYKERSSKFIYVIEGEEKKIYDQYLFNETEFSKMPLEAQATSKALKKYVCSFTFSNFGGLQTVADDALSAGNLDILARFGKVFDLTYTRINDLKQAEAQAKEAKIETALERVRSHSLAMQKSEDLKEVIQVVYDQFVHLNISVEHAGFIIDYKERNDMHIWLADQHAVPFQVTIPYFNCAHWNSFNEAKSNGRDFFTNQLSFEEKNRFYQDLFKLIPGVPGETMDYYLSCPGLAISTVLLDNVGLYIENFSGTPFTEDENNTLMRFGKVFQQTYTRFRDLQKAEAQGREAKIEAALEKARSRTMGMQSSDELPEVANVLFLEVQALGIPAWSCGYNILAGDETSATCCMSSEGTLQQPFKLRLWGEASFDEMGEFLRSEKKMLVQELSDKAIEDHYAYMKSFPDLKPTFDQIEELGLSLPTYQINHLCKFTQGFLLFITYEKVPESHDIFRRFTKVFEQTYTRFLDLQKAEAQAREAQIEASLERVRSKAMAMHYSQDLSNTIVAFYNELELFSITPRRCGVGLINKETRMAELSTMNTTEAGKSIEIVGKIVLETHPVLEQVYENWLLHKEYHPVLRGNEIKEYYQLLRPQMEFPDYPDDTVQFGYFFFFPEGGVYAWTDKEIREEELMIYRRFTSVLSLTYKRYKDLQQAEALAVKAGQDLVLLKEEKKRTEDALSELQVTQKQLIQSEKMASLGELTAGIAHEIQNPLNFVNNFSEVSNELIDEMNEELDKGDIKEAKIIASDIKQNLEKINHHGKRADAIVKGMLQHSRSSSGVKEPTDINALADEYLRLAYHGLRAKDKSFNATLKTDYDESIGNINIIPQDIGRVVLNLISNAFYAASLPTPQGGISDPAKNNNPTVWVSTKKVGDKVFINVKDNGPGIPQKVLDKIFQPFFTTKPTGQGTGLGLSLAYDIVKAHGGELKVETKEGEGAEFIISIPSNHFLI